MTVKFPYALQTGSDETYRVVRNVEILRVSSHLDAENSQTSSEQVRQAVLSWTKKRAGAELPPEAWAHRDFDLLAGGRNSTAVRIETDEIDLWALRADDPDKKVAGRVWTTEVVIGGELGKSPLLSVRLLVSTTEKYLDIDPHVPGFIIHIMNNIGMIRSGRKLRDAPLHIESTHSVEDLCDHIADPERSLPIFVATVPEGHSIHDPIDVATLARATAGIARVFVVPAELTWVITRRFGKVRSVFGGATRAYLPGFSEADDPYRHRLFLSSSFSDPISSNASVSWLRRLAAELSITSMRLGKDVLDFATVRTASHRLRATRLAESAATDAELLSTAKDLVASLERQLEEKGREVDGYIDLIEATEARAAAAEQENRSLLYKFRQNQDATRKGVGASLDQPPLPQSWSEFLDWFDNTYPDRVLLTPSARRMVHCPEFEDVSLVARSISWLAIEHYDRRTSGGGSTSGEHIESGVINAYCGGDKYEVDWKGRRYEVDQHIKSSGNTRNPKRCLRIYYFWEPDLQQTIIDHLPSHRRTGAT